MELNKRKYNWIFGIMIVLIAVVVIFSAVELTQTEEPTTPSDINAEAGDGTQDTPEVVEPEVVIPSNTNYLPKASSFSNGWTAINYANKIMANYSFSSTITQTAVNDEVFGISVRQLVTQKKYKTADETLLISVGTCNNSYGLNYYKYTYMNEVENYVLRRTTYNSKGNFASEPVEHYSISDFESANGCKLYEIYYKLNSTNAKINSFSISGSDYLITLTLNTASKTAFDGFEKSVLTSPAEVRNFKGISTSFEIRISRKTGAYTSIKTVERYSVEKKVDGLGWPEGKVTQNSEEVFTFADINISNLVKSTVIK